MSCLYLPYKYKRFQKLMEVTCYIKPCVNFFSFFGTKINMISKGWRKWIKERKRNGAHSRPFVYSPSDLRSQNWVRLKLWALPRGWHGSSYCCLPGFSLAGSWRQEPALGIKPKQLKYFPIRKCFYFISNFWNKYVYLHLF